MGEGLYPPSPHRWYNHDPDMGTPPDHHGAALECPPGAAGAPQSPARQQTLRDPKEGPPSFLSGTGSASSRQQASTRPEEAWGTWKGPETEAEAQFYPLRLHHLCGRPQYAHHCPNWA